MFWIFIISLFALTHAGSVLPLQTSEVDVRQDHSGFSYNLKENRGVAAIAEPLPLVQPLVKTTIHIEDKPAEIQPQTHQQHQKTEARAHLALKELRKPEELLISQPISALPLEYYGYYYPYSLPRAQFMPSLYSIPSIPYPYTLIRTA
ncbi:unnamed protein product [Ceutorhynchus assimilis]|uniref:Alpha-S1-casein n=1 Tax=Ceutorhynchus assimilis TaxID=467358 RepID=A0A9N9MVC6_9CUCU|nr:unnamed protein product [Ceutorhynchus assimilis]